jgi:hypothetical protein
MRCVANHSFSNGQKDGLYTISDELWALGAVLWRMMLGKDLPAVSGCGKCDCIHFRRCAYEPNCVRQFARSQNCNCDTGGCPHVMGAPPCSHPSFSQPVSNHNCDVLINIDVTLEQLQYSKWLRAAVHILLDYPLFTPRNSSAEVLQAVEDLYANWKVYTRTTVGEKYCDIDDDIRSRWKRIFRGQPNGETTDAARDEVIHVI